ncbi:hypothetical protein L195_g059861, partial [Trifolium pratense]
MFHNYSVLFSLFHKVPFFSSNLPQLETCLLSETLCATLKQVPECSLLPSFFGRLNITQ